MKFGGIRKALLAASPLVVMAGNYFGLGLTPEWWEGVITVITPLAVYWLANNKDSIV